MSLLKAKKKTASTLLVDIGTASIGAGIVSVDSTNTPTLSFVNRMPIGSGTELSRDALRENTLTTLKKVLEQYAKTPVDAVSIMIAAPWHEAHIRSITSQTDHPAPISEKNLVRAVSRYQNEKPPVSGNVDIEAVAVHVQVNGYGTALNRTVSGTTINVNLYESEMASSLQKDITSNVQGIFPHVEVVFNTFPLAALLSMRSLLLQESFVTVDVAGETTELSIVHDNELQHFASFPIGFQTIARAIATQKDGIGDALSRLALWAREELSPQGEEETEKAYTQAFIAWREAFDEALHQASQHTPIPHDLYLLSDKEPVQWMKKAFQEHNTFNLAITSVDSSLFQSSFVLGEKGLYDVFLCIGALFFHTGKTELIGESDGNAVIYSR